MDAHHVIEAAGASLDASVEDYDDVLVTLLSDVATAYVQMRVARKILDNELPHQPPATPA